MFPVLLAVAYIDVLLAVAYIDLLLYIIDVSPMRTTPNFESVGQWPAPNASALPILQISANVRTFVYR